MKVQIVMNWLDDIKLSNWILFGWSPLYDLTNKKIIEGKEEEAVIFIEGDIEGINSLSDSEFDLRLHEAFANLKNTNRKEHIFDAVLYKGKYYIECMYY